MEGSLAGTVVRVLEGPIKHVVSIIISPQNPIRRTRQKKEQLHNFLNEVRHRCDNAISSGEEIIEGVNDWLSATAALLTEVEQWMQEIDENEENTTSLKRWFLAHQQRKNAIRRNAELCEKIRQGRRFESVISRPIPASGAPLLAGTGFIIFKSLEVAFNDTMQFLTREGQGMIGIYGMGGVGKTSLVDKVISDAEAKQLFSKIVVTVVSQTPDVRKIQAQLGDQLGIKYSKETDNGRATQLSHRIKLEKKILVVLDDVWSAIDLTAVGIPFGNHHDHNGIKILLTTRREQVCSLMDCQTSIQLIPLTETEAWGLFIRHVGANLRNPNAELEGVAKKVAKECGGLPLALVVVGGALKDKSLEEWEEALRKLKHSKAVEFEEIGDTVYASIKLSYDFLKAKLTKRCFLMCCLYPEDHEIRVEALTRYALGYGVLDDDLDTYESATNQVIVAMRHLVSCNLLISSVKMSTRSKMHDVVRDAALWIASKGEDVFLVPISSQNNWTRDPKLNNATAISLLSCAENQHLPIRMEYSRLRMLLMAQRIPLQNVQHDCFKRLTSLEVLDMTSISRHLPHLELPSSLQLLCNLRTLLLRRWTLTGDLSMIGNLTSLQLLSFAGSIIANIPGELLGLKELKVLDLSACRIEAGSDYEVMGELSSKLEKLITVKEQISDFIYDD